MRLRALLLLALAACAAPDERARVTTETPPQAPAEVATRHEVPAGWDTASPYGFETIASAVPSGDAPHLWTDDALAAFAKALGAQDETSVRAAVLCARSRDARAADLLLARLELRVLGPDRNSDAGDVVAAAALADWPEREDIARRLTRLGAGPEPHPDLEVRVECAASALRLGAPVDELGPFLLTVLRSLTPEADRHPADWPYQTTVAWAKTRAAEALSERAGLPCRFRPDASYADQAGETARLERALGLAD